LYGIASVDGVKMHVRFVNKNFVPTITPRYTFCMLIAIEYAFIEVFTITSRRYSTKNPKGCFNSKTYRINVEKISK
jgi:hypothetical protein